MLSGRNDLHAPVYTGQSGRSVLQEAFNDRRRLVVSLAVDRYGMASAVGYIFGVASGVVFDSLDAVTALGQTAWIWRAYGNDLTPGQKKVIYNMSLLEELFPGVTDLIPSATIAHFAAAYSRARSTPEE